MRIENGKPLGDAAVTRSRAGRLRVAYLVGTSYCGSTLLSFLASTHPEVASVGEVAPNRKVRRRAGPLTLDCSCQQPLSECPFWKSVFDRVADEGIAMSPDNWSNDYRYVNPLLQRLLGGYSHRPAWRLVQSIAETSLVFPRYRARSIDAANVSFIRAVLDIQQAELFFDTTKGIDRLRRLLHVPQLEIQVVRVLRDVRAYVRSKKRKGQGAAEAASEWLSFQQAADHALAYVSQDRVITLRYEDLAADYQREMRQLFVRLGLDAVDLPGEIDPADHHVLGNSMRLRGPFSVNLNEQWRDEITQQEIAAALRVAGAYQERFGYL